MNVAAEWLWKYKFDIIGWGSTALSQIANAGILSETGVKWFLLGSGLCSSAVAIAHRVVENRRAANVLPPPQQG